MTPQHPERNQTSEGQSRGIGGHGLPHGRAEEQARWVQLPDGTRVPGGDDAGFFDYSPVTAGLVMSVLSRERLAEVMNYFEHHRETAPDEGAAWLLLGALKHEELAAVAFRVNVPVQGKFFELLARLRARCQ